MFTKGREYRRRDLHRLYGGQEQRGISTPSDHRLIFLFSSSRGTEYGYKDGWTEQGTYLYTGEGQRGDMVLQRGNAAIHDHMKNDKELHLFEASRAGFVIYVGEMAYQSMSYRSGPDITGQQRKIIVFELKPVD